MRPRHPSGDLGETSISGAGAGLGSAETLVGEQGAAGPVGDGGRRHGADR